MALNILALVLVLLFVAGGLWLATKFNNKKKRVATPLDGDFEVEEFPAIHTDCPECQGAGAENRLGEIHMCQACDGTGVINEALHQK